MIVGGDQLHAAHAAPDQVFRKGPPQKPVMGNFGLGEGHRHAEYAAAAIWPDPRLQGLLALSPLEFGSKASWPSMAETVIGLLETEVINRLGSWKDVSAVDYATLEWLDWFNNRRLLQPIGYMAPATAERRCFQRLEAVPMAASDSTKPAPGKPGAVQEVAALPELGNAELQGAESRVERAVPVAVATARPLRRSFVTPIMPATSASITSCITASAPPPKIAVSGVGQKLGQRSSVLGRRVLRSG